MNYELTEEESRVVVKDGDGNEAGELTFSISGENKNIMAIDHTVVDDKHRGQGLAQKLVAKAAEKAEKENLKVMPYCAYAKKLFEENEEYRSLLHQ